MLKYVCLQINECARVLFGVKGLLGRGCLSVSKIVNEIRYVCWGKIKVFA